MMIREVPLSEIKIKDRARKEKGDIVGLAETIRQKGLIQPITIDQNGVLLAGERRYLAHRMLNKTTITCIVRHVDSVIDAAEIELIENVYRLDLHWSEKAALEKKINTYKKSVNPEWGVKAQADMRNISTSTVSRRIQLAEAIELIPDLAKHRTEDEAWKEYKRLEDDMKGRLYRKPTTASKELLARADKDYQLGDPVAGMKKLEPKFNFADVDIIDDPAPSTVPVIVSQVYRLLHNDSFAIFWYDMSRHASMLSVIRQAGFSASDDPAIWIRGDTLTEPKPSTLGSTYETFILGCKGSPVVARHGRGNVFNLPRLPNVPRVHPRQRPVILMKIILETFLAEKGSILIPYLNAGVTLRAAYKLQHTGTGWGTKILKEAFLRRIADDQRGIDDG